MEATFERPSGFNLNNAWPLALLGICTLVGMTLISLLVSPAEDAIILLQYSRNLADTGVISFNAGGVRAEGATDFLWMLYFAAGYRLHLETGMLLALVNLACSVGTAVVLLRLAKKKAAPVAVLAVCSLFLFFPQPQAAIKGFSVLPFGFALVLLVLFCEEERDVAAALTALVLCLLRPDGIVFAAPLLCRGLILKPARSRFLVYVALFVVPGCIYFFWRWHYFGQLFPLPFYVKSDAGSLVKRVGTSVVNIAPYLLFSAVAVYAVLARRTLTRRTLSLLVAVGVVPTLFYCCMRLDQNVDDRFYFYLVLVPALLAAVEWSQGAFHLPRKLAGVLLAAYVICVAPMMVKALRYAVGDELRNRTLRAIATQMDQPQLHGTLLTTEAGILPYFSRWFSYDPWGLNTVEFAKKPIQPGDIVRIHPDLIVVHTTSGTPESCALQVRQAQPTRSWDNMTDNVETGVAELGGYQLWILPNLINPVDKLLHRAAGHTPSASCWYTSPAYAGKANIGNILSAQGAVRQ